jgi:hypothetical protein
MFSLLFLAFLTFFKKIAALIMSTQGNPPGE